MIFSSRINRWLHEQSWQESIPFAHPESGSVHVDLGAGNSPRNPFKASTLVATDFHSNFTASNGVKFLQADLTSRLPFRDGEISSFSAYDLLEHIPRWERTREGKIEFPFISLMNEINRCLKTGGIFVAVTPAFPSAAAFQDPTHVNFISRETLSYFLGAEPWARQLGYGFQGSFEVIYEGWLFGIGPYPERIENRLNQLSRKNKWLDYFYQHTRILFYFLMWIKRKLARKGPTHLLWVLRKTED